VLVQLGYAQSKLQQFADAADTSQQARHLAKLLGERDDYGADLLKGLGDA
jgi:hypothetical protein